MSDDAITEIVKYANQLTPLEPYYSMYFYVMWLFSTSLTVAVLYVLLIKKHVSIQAEFKPLVAHTKIASALVMTAAALWQPITIPGYFGGYSVGPLSRFGDDGYLFGQWLTCEFL